MAGADAQTVVGTVSSATRSPSTPLWNTQSVQISRRRFLALSVTVTLAACSSDDSEPVASPDTDPPVTDPPTTSTEAPITTVPPGTTAAASTTTTVPETVFAVDPFVHGVASGDPDDGSVVLWTRLGGEFEPGDIEVGWTVTADDGSEQSGNVVTSAELGYSVRVVVDLDGPATYRFSVPAFTSPEGRTAPIDPDTDEFRLATASCQHYETGHYAAHRDIAEWSPDLVVFLGDFIYEGDATESSDERPTARVHEGTEPGDLDGYRARYSTYLSDPHLQASRAAAPWLAIWDDHEVENDYAGLTSQPDGEADADPAVFATKRDAAYRAWWENMPTRLPAPVPGAPFVIHRGIDVGSLLRISALDGRQYRSDQVSDVILDIGPPADGWDDPGRTMLGAEQEAWVADRFTSSGATWNCIAQQTVLSDTRIGPDGSILNYDQWDGYVPARERLLAGAPDNFVVLTGDIHLSGVATVGPLEDPAGIEFITTAISSTANVDPELTDLLLGIPAIVDGELVSRGYTRHTVTADAWDAEYRSVADVLDADSAVSTWKTFRVATGTAAVTEA